METTNIRFLPIEKIFALKSTKFSIERMFFFSKNTFEELVNNDIFEEIIMRFQRKSSITLPIGEKGKK